MSDRTRQGLAILAAALALGLVADVLGHTVPGRLDAALGLGALGVAVMALCQFGLLPLSRSLVPLGAPLALLAVALIWRDSPTLFALNLLGVGTVGVLASPWLRATGRRRAGLGDYARGSVELVVSAAMGAPALVVTDVDWSAVPVGGRARDAGGAAIGLAAAVPVAAVFGGLLMRADPVFDRLMLRSLDFDVGAVAPTWARCSCGAGSPPACCGSSVEPSRRREGRDAAGCSVWRR
jgi:hypothetical protein